MSQPVSPVNPFVPHIDPKTGKFTTEGFNYFAQVTNQVNQNATTSTAQAAQIAELQSQIALLQKGNGA